MANIKKELSSGQTLLFSMPVSGYNEKIVCAVKQLSGNVCYVTTNKTVDSLREIFKKEGVSCKNVIFIDTISKTMKKVPDQADGVYYVSSPGSLTELSLVVEKFLKHDFDYFIFDSLTNLPIYQSKKMCVKFAVDLIHKIKKVKTKAVFFTISGEENTWIVDHIGQIVDSIVYDAKKVTCKTVKSKIKKAIKKTVSGKVDKA